MPAQGLTARVNFGPLGTAQAKTKRPVNSCLHLARPPREGSALPKPRRGCSASLDPRRMGTHRHMAAYLLRGMETTNGQNGTTRVDVTDRPCPVQAETGHGCDRASSIRHCTTTPPEVSTKDGRTVRTEVKTGRPSPADSNCHTLKYLILGCEYLLECV